MAREVEPLESFEYDALSELVRCLPAHRRDDVTVNELRAQLRDLAPYYRKLVNTVPSVPPGAVGDDEQREKDFLSRALSSDTRLRSMLSWANSSACMYDMLRSHFFATWTATAVPTIVHEK